MTVSDAGVRNMLACLYPTRVERALDRVVSTCYRIAEEAGMYDDLAIYRPPVYARVVDRIGDWADDARVRLARWRAGRDRWVGRGTWLCGRIPDAP